MPGLAYARANQEPAGGGKGHNRQLPTIKLGNGRWPASVPRSDGGAQRRFPGCAQERALEGATAQGDAPCPRHRNGPIRLYWFMASG